MHLTGAPWHFAGRQGPGGAPSPGGCRSPGCPCGGVAVPRTSEGTLPDFEIQQGTLGTKRGVDMVYFGKRIYLSGWPTLYSGAPTPGTKQEKVGSTKIARSDPALTPGTRQHAPLRSPRSLDAAQFLRTVWYPTDG